MFGNWSSAEKTEGERELRFISLCGNHGKLKFTLNKKFSIRKSLSECDGVSERFFCVVFCNTKPFSAKLIVFLNYLL